MKPPTFEELVQRHGSTKAAVQYLLESGFTPEQIEWKMGVPYYLIRLFMAGIQPTNPAQLNSVVKVYERLAVLRSKKGKETELAKFFQRQDLSLELKTRLALSSLTERKFEGGSEHHRESPLHACIVEATYQEVQETDEYTSVYALRVSKIVRFRPDKKIEEIDSIGKMQKLYEMQYERHPFKSL